MKELSIEEKAKAYDEALKIARQYWNNRAMPIGTNFQLTIMFPELKESEDERIRKAIVKMISDIDGGSPFEKYGIIKKEALAWLEKQAEHNSAIFIPKFKVGDWITFTRKDGTREVLQVSDIIDDRYHFNHLLQISWSIKECDEKCHLWTINDAKDGDVLAVNNEVFIYSHRKGLHPCAVAHCFLDSAGGFHFDAEFGYVENGNLISLATKEQRDLLFQKMKESGYEWDAEKKKLKKIERKPQRIVSAEAKEAMYDKLAEWSEEDEKMLNDILMCGERHCYLDAGNIAWLKSLKGRVLPKQDSTDRFFEGFKKGEQSVIENYGKYGLCKPTEWSEEDEEEANYIADFIENLIKKEKLVSKRTMTMEVMVDWLRDVSSKIRTMTRQS
jgi:hypothetical protein